MGRLGDELKKYQRILIDTNLFIYLMEKHPQYFQVAREIFEQIEKGQVYGITSILVLTELLTKPLKDNNENLARSYKAAISTFPNLSVKHIDSNICITAAELRAKYGFKTPDAIFIATAIEEGAEVFITNDIRLRNMAEINCIIISDYLY
ncbi:type II toxin-antitoxin system VapC family toxin [Clostridium oryzae]|uniref:tRNA(fMet)-specific endonuclease VapC n=1 Tax=Clostridium oryzae TaxID=1450648 RepID=A0A1V4IVV0_9CLOT|nr:PIN domain-containing protein [Clostridium oryzae]OPJ64019.1 tRNA(fMet)-specific endonuclease VapC [Clostridium oryzae]